MEKFKGRILVMCGICGKISLNGTRVEEELLRKMARAIEYRGPDDADVFVNRSKGVDGETIHMGFGHQRLSIIDLSPNGHQPMTNEDGTIWITYNGEIYNYRSIRATLIAKGHNFKSRSDTEVIIHLYEEEGIEAVNHLNGMFAFALWDSRKQLLWLCRDRIGIKPLVYTWNGNCLLFASEIKALLCDGTIERQIDPVALQHYLAFSYIPAPHTIYHHIKKLAPGHFATLRKGKLEITCYWDTNRCADSEVPTSGDRQQIEFYKRKIYTTLAAAVKDRMIADVPLGAFLSGGIDSSIIVALMARHSTAPVKTFSIGFHGAPMFDETTFAREVSRMYRTEHYEFKLNADDMLAVIEDALEMCDEPFSDSSLLPTYVVSRETRQHVTVALSGDGGDELFGGYRSYLSETWNRFYRLIPAVFRERIIARLFESLPDARDSRSGEYARRVKKFIRSARGAFPQRVHALKEIMPVDLRRSLVVNSWWQGTPVEPDPAFEQTRMRLNSFNGDQLNRILYSDLKDSLPSDMLNKVDWMSMRNSLEVRVPFLDHRLVNLAFQMPGRLKIRRGRTKYILKETFKDILPASLYSRPKVGFEVPISQWLRRELRFLIEDYLAPKSIRNQGIFDEAVIARLIRQHLTGRTDTAWILWNLIVFQYWHRRYACG